MLVCGDMPIPAKVQRYSVADEEVLFVTTMVSLIAGVELNDVALKDAPPVIVIGSADAWAGDAPSKPPAIIAVVPTTAAIRNFILTTNPFVLGLETSPSAHAMKNLNDRVFARSAISGCP